MTSLRHRYLELRNAILEHGGEPFGQSVRVLALALGMSCRDLSKGEGVQQAFNIFDGRTSLSFSYHLLRENGEGMMQQSYGLTLISGKDRLSDQWVFEGGEMIQLVPAAA